MRSGLGRPLKAGFSGTIKAVTHHSETKDVQSKYSIEPTVFNPSSRA